MSSRLIRESYRRAVIRRNGDVLPTLLVDGRVVGVWRVTDDGVEARAFEELPDAAWDGLGGEAAGLAAWLARRRARPYGRFRNWWDDLPAGPVRILG